MTEHLFIVGAQRSGTTYVYEMLDIHPQICMAKPVRPEPKFFLNSNLSDSTYATYLETYFHDRTSLIFGEKSTSYIESEYAAKHISHWFPTAKIIMILRNPIDRAISNYYFSKKNKLETLSIEEAFLKEPERRNNYDHNQISASPFAYLQRGHYINYIRMYEKYFRRDQIKILIHEEFAGRIKPLRQLYQWLLVEADYDITQDPKIPVNASNTEKQAIPDSLQTYLIDHFAPSVARLEDYLGRSLKEWSQFGKNN